MRWPRLGRCRTSCRSRPPASGISVLPSRPPTVRHDADHVGSKKSRSKCFTRIRARRDDLPTEAQTRRMHPLSSTEIEQTLVLEGSIEDHDGMTTAGDYIWRKPGSLHDNMSPGGAVLFGCTAN